MSLANLAKLRTSRRRRPMFSGSWYFQSRLRSSFIVTFRTQCNPFSIYPGHTKNRSGSKFAGKHGPAPVFTPRPTDKCTTKTRRLYCCIHGKLFVPSRCIFLSFLRHGADRRARIMRPLRLPDFRANAVYPIEPVRPQCGALPKAACHRKPRRPYRSGPPGALDRQDR